MIPCEIQPDVSSLMIMSPPPQGLSVGVQHEGGEGGGRVHPGKDSGECSSV